jgi:hypothetical protein
VEKISETKGSCLGQGRTQTPENRNLKNRFGRYYDKKVLRDLPFSRNQPLKSAGDQYIRILKNKLIQLKKPEDRTL